MMAIKVSAATENPERKGGGKACDGEVCVEWEEHEDLLQLFLCV